MTTARKTARELLEASGLLDAEVVGALVDGRLVDLHTPLEVTASSAPPVPVRRDSPKGLELIRHSTAHVMADAVQRLFPGTQVTIGPAIESGFYYDFDKQDGPFTDKDLLRIEKEMRRIIAAKQPFVREAVSREEAVRRFEALGERYKLELIAGIPEDAELTLYRHGSPGRAGGEWVDLCAGPHVPTTGHLGAVKLTSVAGAYWRGNEQNPMLQRIYGTAFATQEELDAHLARLEEAKQRDHRKLGKELGLFMFHDFAPAMPFFLPRGAGVYARMADYVRSLYVPFGYEEVLTPQIFDRRLFDTSGHTQNYRDNMYFAVTADALDEVRTAVEAGDLGAAKGALPGLERLAQKPMNCPSHCLMFAARRRSYRELPWRVADFGRLHRYERGGAVHGLARVRSFCQDDAHIFCAPEQLEAELREFNALLFEVYRAFGFSDVSVKLALRPDQRVGTDAEWDLAEQALEKVLRDSGIDFETLPGEGAFYGPKLEFHVVDALGRGWQLGTIQLDYALPERFGLEYIGADGAAHRPVMLHRAILGSLERFFSMYLEHIAGKFPVWLAPEQLTLLTVGEKQTAAAESAAALLRASGLRVELDVSADKLGAKIRNARLMRLPYLGVIGAEEAEAGTISLRSRDEGELGVLSVEAVRERLCREALPPRISSGEATQPRVA